MKRKNPKIRFPAFVAAAAVLALVLALPGCDISGGGSSTVTDGETRAFYAANVESGYYESVTAVKRFTGTHSIIYVEQSRSASLSDALVQDIASEFDVKIYAMVHSYFADTSTAEDVDKNGKVIILLLDVQDGYVDGSGGGYVAGFFDSTHMFLKTTYSVSNQADMLFMDIYPGLLTSSGTVDTGAYQDFKVTMAHEFQHLVDFSEKRLVQGKPDGNDTWIDEGLSSAAEYLYQGSHVGWKVDYYNYSTYSTTDKYGIVHPELYNPVDDANLWGQNFLSWGVWGDQLVNYSTVYLFFQWLRLQSDPSIYKAILSNTNTDYQAVLASASGKSIGSTWKGIIQSWFAANYHNHSTSLYGYKNDLTDGKGNKAYLKPRYFTAIKTGDLTEVNSTYTTNLGESRLTTGGVVNLWPGDAVYLKPASTQTVADSGNVAYQSVNPADQATVDTDGNYAPSDILIAMNVDGNPPSILADLASTSAIASGLIASGNTTTALVSTLAPPAGSLVLKSTSAAAGSKRTRFPIDAVIGRDSDGTMRSSLSPGRKGGAALKR